MYRFTSLLAAAICLFTTGIQGQIKNSDFSVWIEAQSSGEVYYDPQDWATSNQSILTMARVSVVENTDGLNSIAHISSTNQGTDAQSSGYISQEISTSDVSVLSLWAKCDSLYGNSGCVLAVKALDGTVLQTDTTKTVDTDYRKYEMTLDSAVIANHNSIVLWIEAQGALDPWDDQEDGFSVFLVDEVKASQTSLNFEFLDHRSKTITLEAAQDIDEGLLYVSCDRENRSMMVNLANDNCDLDVLFEAKMEYAHIQVINDSTQVVFLENFDTSDLFFGGFFAVRVENGVVVDIFEDFDLNFDDNSIWNYTWHIDMVQLDSLENWIIDSYDEGFFQYRDSILTPLTIQGDLFLNKAGDWFVYDESDLSYFDGTNHTPLLSNQNIIDLRFQGDNNYLLSSDTLFRYNDQFTNLEMSWALPEQNLPFDQILLSDSKITFLINEVDEFTLFENIDGQQSSLTYPKDTTESLSLLSSRGDEKVMFSGVYLENTIEHLFFREFSLSEENSYDRVDLSIDEYGLIYDTTTFFVDPIVIIDTTFVDHYEFRTAISNQQDRTIDHLNAYSKYYLMISNHGRSLTVTIDEALPSNASVVSSDSIFIYFATDCFGSTLELLLTGANFKFNQNENRRLTPDFVSSVSSLEDLNIKVYPNPFSDQINLEGIENFHSWQLYDMYGRLVRRGVARSSNLDLSGLRSGSYVLLITTTEGEQFHQTLIKQ